MEQDLTNRLIYNDTYHVLERVDKGGFGVVWKAKNLSLGDKLVALKFFTRGGDVHTSISQTDVHSLGRLSTSNHRGSRHIVYANHYFRGDETLDAFLEMEWMEGGNLHAMIHGAAKPMEEHVVRRIASQLVLALSCAHKGGIIHCDLKPRNVLLSSDGLTVKLSDFGLAAKLGMDPDHHGGSLPYMSPEQLRKEKLTPATDVFSLGILLYECFERKTPYAIIADRKAYIAARRDSEDFHVPRMENTKVSDEMKGIILRCLSANADSRPTLAELSKFLRISSVEVHERERQFQQYYKYRTPDNDYYIAHRETGMTFMAKSLNDPYFRPVMPITNQYLFQFLWQPVYQHLQRSQLSHYKHDGGYLETWFLDRPQADQRHYPVCGVPYEIATEFCRYLGGSVLPTQKELLDYLNSEESPLRNSLMQWMRDLNLPFWQFWCRENIITDTQMAPMVRYPDDSSLAPLMSMVRRPVHYCFKHYSFFVFLPANIWEAIQTEERQQQPPETPPVGTRPPFPFATSPLPAAEPASRFGPAAPAPQVAEEPQGESDVDLPRREPLSPDDDGGSDIDYPDR